MITTIDLEQIDIIIGQRRERMFVQRQVPEQGPLPGQGQGDAQEGEDEGRL